VNDQAAWEQALATADEWYAGLPAGTRAELDSLLEEIMQLKEGLVELVSSAGSAAICRECGGECCLLGRYHVSLLDILAYRKTGIEPVIPDFSAGPACPYSDASGCLMPPRYRPVTCVIFNCQQIEDRVTPVERENLYEHERKLRATVSRAGQTCGTRLDRPLLLAAADRQDCNTTS
jgi:hypothetical protein